MQRRIFSRTIGDWKAHDLSDPGSVLFPQGTRSRTRRRAVSIHLPRLHRRGLTTRRSGSHLRGTRATSTTGSSSTDIRHRMVDITTTATTITMMTTIITTITMVTTITTRRMTAASAS